jgi:hypothetical protein
VRLTVTAKLVVRVTRPEILRQYAADAQRAMAEAHSPGDFGEFAYLAVTSEGLDEIAEGPAGQLRFLLNASDVIGGTRGNRDRGVRSVRRGDAARRRNSSGSGIPPVK